MVWAVKKFRHYLHGRPFEILTDHHALKWLQSARFSNSKLERWALALQEHDYQVDYHKGEDNVIADCLSRAEPLPGKCMSVLVACALADWEGELVAARSACVHTTEVDLDDFSKTEHTDYIRCVICNDPGGANNMAFCSGCNRPFHLRCHLPPMAAVPIGEWYCLSCSSQAGQLEELYDPDTLLEYFPQDFHVNAPLMQCVRSGGLGLMPPGPERRALKRYLKHIRQHPTYPDWIQVNTRCHRTAGPVYQAWRTSPPVEYRWGVIRMYHDLLGHAGIEHTHKAMAKQVYWPDMKKDVSAFCMACLVCQQRKAAMYDVETRESTMLHGPLKHIHVDLAGPFKVEKRSVTFDETTIANVSPRRSSRAKKPVSQPFMQLQHDPGPAENNKSPPSPSNKSRQQQTERQSKPEPPPMQQHWVLIIVDYFTKAAELIAIPTKAAEYAARILFDQWFCRYGTPEYVTSDNGTEFQGEFTAMLERLGIVHITTAVRHPQSNGVCERLVGTFKRKLFSYCDGHPAQWISYLPRLRHAYMQEVHSATHYSPFEMVYGFTPSYPLPVKINLMDAQNSPWPQVLSRPGDEQGGGRR